MKNYRKLKDLIKEIDTRNSKCDIQNLMGVSITKEFIPSVANIVGTDLSRYKVIKKNQFACSLMQVSRDGGIAVSLYKNEKLSIMSPAYYIFEVTSNDILPEYLNAIFCSKTFDREAVFNAVGGVRGTLTWDDFCDIEIFVPSVDEQTLYLKKYNSIITRINVLKEHATLDNHLQSLIFTRFLQNNVHLCKTKKMNTIFNIKYGKGLPTTKLKTSGNKVYGGNGVIGFFDNYTYEKPQILVSCRGAASGKIIISSPKSFVTSNSLVLELSDYKYFEFYKSYFLLNPLYNCVTGSAQQQITIDNLNDVEIPYYNFNDIEELSNRLKIVSSDYSYIIDEMDLLIKLKSIVENHLF